MSAPPCLQLLSAEGAGKKTSHEALCSQGRVLFLLEHLGQNLLLVTLIKIRFCYSRQLKDFRHILVCPRAETVPVLQGSPEEVEKQQLESRVRMEYRG